MHFVTYFCLRTTAGDLLGQSQLVNCSSSMLNASTAAVGTEQLPPHDDSLSAWLDNSSSSSFISSNDATNNHVDSKQQQQQQQQQLTVEQLCMYRQRGVLPAWHELPSWARNNTRRAMSEILAATARARSKTSKALLLEGMCIYEFISARTARALMCDKHMCACQLHVTSMPAFAVSGY